MTHLSLFSGIGGLDLAAEWAGIQTIGQCEWADYPTKVLEKHWPNVPRWKDIRTLTKESFYERTGRGTVDIISGGFPCQPFSVAGKQRGKEDDRYLWPEMVRVIKELRPTWIIGENVAGIVKMALPDILSELESCGYRTRTFLIPACGVGARHRRYRVAIVGYTEHNGSSSAKIIRSTEKAGRGQQKREKTSCEPAGAGKPGNSKVMGRTENLENASHRRCSEPENVCEQPWRAESEWTGKTLANTKSKYERGLSIGEEQEESGLIGGNENVQYPNGAGREEQYPSGKPDRQRFVGGGCDERNDRNAASARLPDGTGHPLGGQGTPEPEPERPDRNVPNSDDRSGTVRRERELSAAEETGRSGSDNGRRAEEHEPREWRTAQSVLGGVADGLPAGMDRDFLIDHYWDEEPDIPRVATGIEHRVDRLKCLGNAVVPQQFYPIFRAIYEVENENRTTKEN